MTKEINDFRSEIKQEANNCNEIFGMWLNNTTNQQIMLLFKQQTLQDRTPTLQGAVVHRKRDHTGIRKNCACLTSTHIYWRKADSLPGVEKYRT